MFTVWNQSVVNEKPYTLSLACIAIVSWLTVRWSANPESDGAGRYLVLIAYLIGLGYTNHMAGMLPAPAIGVAVLVRRRPPSCGSDARRLPGRARRRPDAVHHEPIRAAYFPAINEGEPTGCRTEIALACTFSHATAVAFEYNLDRIQYGKPELSDRQPTFTQQLGIWWLYFKWQWLRDPNDGWQAAQALMAARSSSSD